MIGFHWRQHQRCNFMQHCPTLFYFQSENENTSKIQCKLKKQGDYIRSWYLQHQNVVYVLVMEVTSINALFNLRQEAFRVCSVSPSRVRQG